MCGLRTHTPYHHGYEGSGSSLQHWDSNVCVCEATHMRKLQTAVIELAALNHIRSLFVKCIFSHAQVGADIHDEKSSTTVVTLMAISTLVVYC